MLCPKLSWLSVLLLITLIQIGVFITELAIGGIEKTTLLAANPETLEDMGQKDPYKMRHTFQVYRFFVPMFLHADLPHIIGNLIA